MGRNTKVNNLVGEVHAGVEVIGDSGERNKSGDILWLCRCLACGNETTKARKFDLVRGDYQSCGCLKLKIITTVNSTHGMASEIEYTTWRNMKDRCYNPNSDSYHRYGGRGIGVSEEWLTSFRTFYEDMGPRPSDEHSIDRIDNNKGYSKENCRWATRSQQGYNQNKRSETTSKYKNVYWNKSACKWMARVWVDKKRIYLGSFEDEHEAWVEVEKYHAGKG